MIRENAFPTFYVDDSTVEIDGRNHAIVAGISFADEEQAISDWLSQKRTCGLPPYEEVKWNKRTLTFEQRREFVPALNKGTGIAVIHEGGKQAAALKFVEQVWAYANENCKSGFRIRFDKGIVGNWQEVHAAARSYFPPCVGLSEQDSAAEQLLQCADFLAGCMKLEIDFGIGSRDPNRKIQDPELGETELSFFFFAALRYCLWGKTAVFDEEETSYPIKSTINRGVVLISSAPQNNREAALAFLDGQYMGCIH